MKFYPDPKIRIPCEQVKGVSFFCYPSPPTFLASYFWFLLPLFAFIYRSVFQPFIAVRMALMDEREQDTVYEEDESFYQVRALNKNKVK
jgi:hypothetical protein